VIEVMAVRMARETVRAFMVVSSQIVTGKFLMTSL